MTLDTINPYQDTKVSATRVKVIALVTISSRVKVIVLVRIITPPIHYCPSQDCQVTMIVWAINSRSGKVAEWGRVVAEAEASPPPE